MTMTSGKIIFNKQFNDIDNEISPSTDNHNNTNLHELVNRSQRVILKISSVFPLDLFPDHVIVDEVKVSLIQKDLFGADYIHSVLLENISNVVVVAGALFATLRIIDSTNPRATITLEIHNLRKSDAYLTRRIIQGLITTRMRSIDLSKLEVNELREELELLGKAKFAE